VYQNEVDEEIKGVDSRNKVKHNERIVERITVIKFRVNDSSGTGG